MPSVKRCYFLIQFFINDRNLSFNLAFELASLCPSNHQSSNLLYFFPSALSHLLPLFYLLFPWYMHFLYSAMLSLTSNICLLFSSWLPLQMLSFLSFENTVLILTGSTESYIISSTLVIAFNKSEDRI